MPQATQYSTLGTQSNGGSTPYRNISLLATGVNVKSSAANVYGWVLTNNAAAARFVKLYNKATAPTVGTDTPYMTIQVPAGQTISAMFSVPISFSLGVGIGATVNVADADATAPSANDVVANLLTN